MRTLLSSLSHQTYVFNTLNPITTLPDFQSIKAELIDAHTFELQMENQVTLNDIFSLLTKENILINSVHNKVNRLEALYMDLVHHAH